MACGTSTWGLPTSWATRSAASACAPRSGTPRWCGGSFPLLLGKTGALLRTPYDWTEEVRGITAPVQLVHGDADSIPPAHAAEFVALLGGGLRDAGWDGAGRPASRLAVLPGRTHYDVSSSPELAGVVDGFLG